jgi:hypothetical protein
MWCVKPAVDKNVDAGNINDQENMILAVVDHPALVAARALAGILSKKEQAAALYISKQTVQMLGHAHSNVKVRGKPKRKNAMPLRLSCCFQRHCPPGHQPTRKQLFQASMIVLSCLGFRIQHLNVSINALEARMSLMIREGEVGAVITTDEAAMGYYIVQWKSEPYALQVDAEGILGIVTAGAMAVDGLYFSRVQ